jgi:hypothetical protein
MGTLTGKIIDKTTGEPVEARVQVVDASGAFAHPADALLKVGPGSPFFYSDGSFQVNVGRGKVKVIVERGTEYTPAEITLDAPHRGSLTVDLELERWSELGEQGWHPGNTHIHYDEKEKRPDDRLMLDPRVEDLRMTAISILKRWDLEYASNKYAPGFMNEFSSTHFYVECGEESRHNALGTHAIGYGHVMFLNIHNVVEPVSRGLLVDAFDPDYPPLIYACDDTHRQGGVVIWCHNGQGMEAPVAAALGKLDAFNLFDPEWKDPEYDIYYRMLNAGIKLPASTGSDWFVSNANRVYAHTGKAFEYEDWLTSLKNGQTFITNGPSLSLAVADKTLGEEIYMAPGQSVPAVTSWTSHYPIHRAEMIFNGKVVAAESYPEGSKAGALKADVILPNDGWISSRLFSDARDSFAQPVWAHTSPIYVKTGAASPEKKEAALWFEDHIEKSLEWVTKKGKFYTDSQRKEVIDLFKQGQAVYREMV